MLQHMATSFLFIFSNLQQQSVHYYADDDDDDDTREVKYPTSPASPPPPPKKKKKIRVNSHFMYAPVIQSKHGVQNEDRK
jgi:hypothetical protein